MSLHLQTDFAVPEQTARVARRAFPKGNRYTQMRDELGSLSRDEDFAGLYPRRGQPAAAPWRLALVTVMQFGENLTDRQAADAVRARIDWKCALGLELDDAGFDFSILSEPEAAPSRWQGRGKTPRPDAGAFPREEAVEERQTATHRPRAHIVGAVHELNRLEIVGETLHHVLNVLAQGLGEQVDES